jgi:hypothetical protein
MPGSAGQSIQSASSSARSVGTASWRAEYEKTFGNPTQKNFSHVFRPRKLPSFFVGKNGNDSVAKEERAAMDAAARPICWLLNFTNSDGPASNLSHSRFRHSPSRLNL